MPKYHRLPWIFMGGIVLIILIEVASLIELPYYALAPGNATSVEKMIVLPADKSHKLKGEVMMVDVAISRVRLISYLPDILNSNMQIVKSNEILGTMPSSELDAQSLVQMAFSKQIAEFVALKKLCYPVSVRPQGAMIYQTLANSPAFSTLKVGEIIVSVNKKPTLTLQEVSSRISSSPLSAPIDLGVRFPKSKKLTYVQVMPTSKVVNSKKVPFIGVYLLSWLKFNFPFPVSIDTQDIGGPSAGLAFTLGLIDQLGGGGLTGGKKVAATGTISFNGQVGPIGGIAEKTVAVDNAGAQIFFVPPDEYAKAKSKAGKDLKVVPVSSLDQALTYLLSQHGHLNVHTCKIVS
ncbi:MAG: hypothetical protein M1483_02705 [Actinobacteria bacterium]|nr:hypothetical protein [Actinomycetota bacterium]